jgi:hypothetical protein
LGSHLLMGPSNFDLSAESRVRGYDFTSFLGVARGEVRPML